MEQKKCKECARYIQHYAFLEGKFRPVFCGHCMEKKRGKMKPLASVCENYVPGEPTEEQLVTKEYLTKELLQHILKMELWEP